MLNNREPLGPSTIIFIVGPTSSGKSAVAASLAERIGGEVISCDSMQVYQDMDVITRPPDGELLSRVKHYLIKIIPPEEEFNAARFVEAALSAIDSVIACGKIPIFAGGTGLYIKALVDGIFDSPPKDVDLRAELTAVVAERGAEYLHKKLKTVDPETAEKLHPNDTQRIIRALEVYELTGSTINSKKAESEGISDKYECKFFGLEFSRNLLYERIENTVDKMFDEGLVAEVKALVGRKLSLTAQKALGIKEISDFLNGQIEIEAAKVELKKNTRRYAKRQLTWFRADARIMWIDANRGVDDTVSDIKKRINV